MTKMDNPIISYITSNLGYFTEESKRLFDKGVLEEYSSLAFRFLDVERKLGTSDHEAALRILSEDFIRARSAVIRDWNETWRSFFRWRAKSKEWDREQRQSHTESERFLAEIEALILENDAMHPEAAAALNAHLKPVLEIGRATVAAPPIRFSQLPRVILLIDLHTFAVYLRYVLARGAFLFLKHSFIILVLVLVFGTLYSKGAAAIATLAAEHVAALTGRVALIVFAAAVAKRYLVDPRLKRLQVKLESRWLSRLALKLHAALTLELTSRTARRR